MTMENSSGQPPGTPVRLLGALDQSEMGLTLTPDQRQLVEVDEAAADEGYDSDGNLGPFFNQVEDESDMVMEEEVQLESRNANEDVDVDDTPSVGPSAEPTFCSLSEEEIRKLKVVEMKSYLKDKYGIKCSTWKQKELREKMMEVVRTQQPFISNLDESIVSNLANDDFFATGAYWKELKQEDEIQEDDGLVVEGEQFRAPTLSEGEIVRTKKRNYSEKIHRPPFIQEVLLPKRDDNGKIIKDDDDEFVYEKKNTEETVPNVDFLHQHNINLESSPADSFDVFFQGRKLLIRKFQ